MKKIVLIGHSHSVAILDAVALWRSSANLEIDGQQDDKRYTEKFQGWFSSDTQGRLLDMEILAGFEAFSGMKACVITSATKTGPLAKKAAGDDAQINIVVSDFLSDFAKQVADYDTVISIMHGSEHALLSIIDNLPPYDFAPYETTEGYQPIDRKYIDGAVAGMVQAVALPLLALRHLLPKATLLHVPPPPPLREPEQAGVLEEIEGPLRRFGFTRASLRLKWYRAYIEALTATLTAYGIAVAQPDYAEAVDDGFLKPDYAEGLTHGNARYGALVAAQLAPLVQGAGS